MPLSGLPWASPFIVVYCFFSGLLVTRGRSTPTTFCAGCKRQITNQASLCVAIRSDSYLSACFVLSPNGLFSAVFGSWKKQVENQTQSQGNKKNTFPWKQGKWLFLPADEIVPPSGDLGIF